MREYKKPPRRRNINDGQVEEDPWVPVIQDTHLLQDIERRRATDIERFSDPNVVVAMSPDVKFASPPSSSRTCDLFDRQLAVNAISCGYDVLRKVQSTAYPYLKRGCNLALVTPGATGKTTAYLLPMIQKVIEDLRARPHRLYHPRAVILVNSKEHAKVMHDKVIALTDGLAIKSTFVVSQMTLSAFTLRDNADIFITTAFNFVQCLNENRLTLAFLKYLVIDSFDDLLKEWSFRPESIRELFKYYDNLSTERQLVLVADDKTAMEQSYWNDRILSANNTVILESQAHQKMSPANHLLVRIRAHLAPEAVVETINHYGGGSALVVVPDRMRDIPHTISGILKVLRENDISAEYYHTQMSMPKRETLLREFTMGNFRVLVTKYCCQMRNIRFPALRQVIHVGSPYRSDESYTTSYHFSSSVVAYMPHARSVVLVNVDHSKQAGKNVKEVVEAITESTKELEWKKFYIPGWARRHIDDPRCSWSTQDCKDAEILVDLKMADPVETGGKQKNDEAETNIFRESPRPQVAALAEPRGNSPFDFRPDEWSPQEGISRQEMGRRDHAYVKKEEHYSSSDESCYNAARKRGVSESSDRNRFAGEMVFHRRRSGRQPNHRGQMAESRGGPLRREERRPSPRREKYDNGSHRQRFERGNDEPRRGDRQLSPRRRDYSPPQTRRFHPTEQRQRTPPRHCQDHYRDYSPPARERNVPPPPPRGHRNDYPSRDARDYGRMERRERSPEVLQLRRRPSMDRFYDRPPVRRQESRERMETGPRRDFDYGRNGGRPIEDRMARDVGQMSLRERRPEPPRQGYRNDGRLVQREDSRESPAMNSGCFGRTPFWALESGPNTRYGGGGFEEPRRERSPPRREMRAVATGPYHTGSWEEFENRGKSTHDTYPRRQSSPRREIQRNGGSHRYSENRRGSNPNCQSQWSRSFGAPPMKQSACSSSSERHWTPRSPRKNTYNSPVEEEFELHPKFAENGGMPARNDVLRRLNNQKRREAADKEITGRRRSFDSEDEFGSW